MSGQAPEQPVSVATTDPLVRRLREFVSAALAIVIILVTVAMLIQATNHLSTPEEFDRVKDLLLFINPLLGVVVGYYFNKAISEPRAEIAETTAQDAMATAQQASEARNKAEAEADAAQSEAQDVKSALREVSDAAERMVVEAPPAVGVLGVDEETGEPLVDPRMELQMALRHARRFIE